MKMIANPLIAAVAAFGFSGVQAHPAVHPSAPTNWPFYGNVTTAGALTATNSPNATAGVHGNFSTNATSVVKLTSSAMASTFAHVTTLPTGQEGLCSISVTTTTVFIVALDMTSSQESLVTANSATSASDTYFYSIVNGTTAWSGGNAPPTDALSTIYLTTTEETITAGVNSGVEPTPGSTTYSDVTITMTNTRTLTSIVVSASSSRTETIFVTETQTITTTTIHWSPTAPTAPASVPGITVGSFTATVNAMTAGSARISSSGPESSSSEENVTVRMTSSHTITVTADNTSLTSSSMPASSIASTGAVSYGLPQTSTGGSVTLISPFETVPAVITPTLASPVTSVPMASDTTLTQEGTMGTFPSFAPSVSSGLSFAGAGSGSPWTSTIGWNGTSTTQARGTATDSGGSTTPLTPATGQHQSTSSAPSKSTEAGIIATGIRSHGFPFPMNSTLPTSVAPKHLSTTVGSLKTQVSMSTKAATSMTSISSLSVVLSRTSLPSPVVPVFTNFTAHPSTLTLSVGLLSSRPITPKSGNSTGATVPKTLSSTSLVGHGSSSSSSSPSWTSSTPSSSLAFSTSASATASSVSQGPPIGSSSAAVSSTVYNSIVMSSPRSTEGSPVSNTLPSTLAQGSVPWTNATSTTSTIMPVSSTVYSGAPSSYVPWVSSSTTSANAIATSQPGYGPPSQQSCVNAELGDFVMNWDDEPLYTPSTSSEPPFAPVFNPYHHLFFASGYSYYTETNSSTPPEPYNPVSGPNVAIFHIPSIPIAQADKPDEYGMLPGIIGAGPRSSDDAYWFNAYSVEMGCDNGGADPCNMTISGFKWDDASKEQKEFTYQFATIQTCTQLEDCELDHIELSPTFRNLSSIRFEAVIDDATVNSFILDNFSMGWADNSCEAGQKRVNEKK